MTATTIITGASTSAITPGSGVAGGLTTVAATVAVPPGTRC